ncbi:hypothetical protein ACE106_15145 [Shouchella clausii]|uniref:hypothetical protein n=1 Tax=Shouchella clausii TaxID=79880 RepID=UPI0028983342|nr:hypothetical protein [Shouchella clausii]
MGGIRAAMTKHRADVINLLAKRGVYQYWDGRSLHVITYSELIWQLEDSYKKGGVQIES